MTETRGLSTPQKETQNKNLKCTQKEKETETEKEKEKEKKGRRSLWGPSLCVSGTRVITLGCHTMVQVAGS